MLIAHKIALGPTDKQRTYFARASGAARFAYNWALGEWKRRYEAGQKPLEPSLRRQLNASKREQFPWMSDVTKCAVQEAMIDWGTALRAFFEKRGAYPRFTALLKRLGRSSRGLSRKQKGARHRTKAKKRLGRLHARMAKVRKDATHQAATRLVKTYRRIGLEGLNVRGMARHRHLARSIREGGFFEFRRQLDYKARFYGATIVVADRGCPSSKAWSCCGSVVADLALSQRRFGCLECGLECDRDRNAALNLERLAASSAASACGEQRSGAVGKGRVKRASVKQDPNGKEELCAA